jgi:fumarate reductase subunit C
MSEKPVYTEYHPKWYRARVSTYWWSKRWSYVAFILRELSSVFIAWFVIFTLLQVRALSQGEEDYRRFVAWSGHPVALAVNAVSLLFVTFHAITWFNLAPKAMVVHLRGKQVPGRWIALSNYLAWALVSALLAWIILGG